MSEETINDSGIVLGRTFPGSDIEDDVYKSSEFIQTYTS